MKQRTFDRIGFYTTEKLGATREITPEGFLLCKGVAIARTGEQIYTPEEIPLDDGGTGQIRILRVPEEVFREETIASFEGKPVTVGHPDDFVTPENWNQLAVGVVQNVRQGEGIEDDLLIADLLITAADAIEYVNRELPELSAGYEASYEQTEPGRGTQREIVGNHVALVERGRAGPRCSILDHVKEDLSMKKRSFWDRLMTAVKAKDEEAIKAELESKDADEAEEKQEPKDDPVVNQSAGDSDINARLDKIEAILAKLVPVEEQEHQTQFDSEEEENTEDTVLEAEKAESNPDATGKVLSGDSMKNVISRAEILSPGIAVPTGDSIKSGMAEKLMRKALEGAMQTEQGKACVDPFLMGRDMKKLTGDSLAGVFNGAAELMRLRNNDRGARNAISTADFGRATSVSDINARNREFWAKNAR